MPANTTFPARRTRNEQRVYLDNFAELYEKLAPSGLPPPQAIANEESLLGAIMIDTASLKHAIETIGERNPFYRESHGNIYRAAFTLAKRGEPVDPLTVSHELTRMGFLEQTGGPAYLVELTTRVVTTVNTVQHARVVMEKHFSRELIRICEELKLRGFEDEMDIFDLIREAESFIGALAAQARDARGYFGTTVFRLRDFKEKYDMLYTDGLPSGLSTALKKSFTTQDGKEIYTIQRGTTTLVTGIPSHGKSAFIDNITVPLAADEGWKFAYFSPEMLPLELHAASFAEIWSGLPFNTGFNKRMDELTKDKAAEFIDEHFYYFVARDLPFSVDAVLERATSLALKEGIQGLVIDPWNHLDHDMEHDERGDMYLRRNLLKLQMWAERMNVWVCVLAHPTKLQSSHGVEPVPTPYTVKGGSEWFDMMDFCLAVWRDKKDERKPTQIHVQKCRFRNLGALGVAQISYDKPCGRFVDSGIAAGSVITKDAPNRQGGWQGAGAGAGAYAGASGDEGYPGGFPGEDSRPYWMQGRDYE